MGEEQRVVYELDGKVVADVRSADELAARIELYPGYAVVEKVKLSEMSRGGIVLPNAEVKEQHHLMLWRIAVAGPQKHDRDGKPIETRAKVDLIVVLKPPVSQFLVNQRHQFGVIQDQDIIGIVKFDDATTESTESLSSTAVLGPGPDVEAPIQE